MRITVGQVLIVGGLGAYAALGPSQVWDKAALEKKMSSVVSTITSLMDLFKSGAQRTPTVVNTTETALNPVSPPTTEAPAPAVLETKAAVEEPVVPPAAAVTKKPQAAPAVKRRTRRRTTKTRSTKAPLRKTPAANAQAIKDPLLGSYVALTLKSGREVKGILQERTASTYKIELPGMGPFTYNADTVTKIEAAQ